MLYLSIFILSRRCKIKFHGDRPSRKSIWTNLDPKSSIFMFFAILGPIFLLFFVPLAGNVVLCQCHSIRPTSLTCFHGTKWSRDKMEPGQNGSRTKWIQDKMDPGQNGSRTRWIQDKREPGQYGSRTIGNHKDNREP